MSPRPGSPRATSAQSRSGRSLLARRLPALFLSATLAAACSSGAPPAPVALMASAAAIEQMVGSWRGDYTSGASGRSGVIRFEVAAAERTTAAGEVTMFSDPLAGESDAPGRDQPRSRVLSIRFVALRGDQTTVVGALEPYRDPECSCLLSTSFVGRMDGDRIEGTFISHGGPGHPVATGRWQVDRRR